MSYFEAVLETLQSIQKEVKATRHAILHQTKLLQESKETPKEAAPALKAVTWQEAVRYLHDYCRSVNNMECTSGRCPMAGFCGGHLKGRFVSMPCNWEVPADE